MVRNLSFLVGLVAALAALPATAAERRIGLTSFDRIVVEGDYLVEVTGSTRVGAVATGEPGALDLLSIEVRDRTLIIRRKPLGEWASQAGETEPVTIRLTAAGLRQATMVGGGVLSVRGIKAAELKLSLTGPGRLESAAIDVDRLSVSLTGSGSATLAGAASTFDVRVTGAGSLDARELMSDNLTLVSEGAANSLFNARRTAELVTRGIGRVEVFGKAPCTVKGKGVGSVTCEHGKPLRAD